jgi:hypothetical protein
MFLPRGCELNKEIWPIFHSCKEKPNTHIIVLFGGLTRNTFFNVSVYFFLPLLVKWNIFICNLVDPSFFTA